MGWSGAAGAIAKAGETVAGPGAAATVARAAAGAGGVLATGAAVGAVTGGKIPVPDIGSMFEGSFSSANEPVTPEVKAIQERYFPKGQTAAQKGEAGRRLWLDALSKERPWRGSAIQAQHPDWAEEQVAREWVRYFLGDNAARDFTLTPG